MSKTTILIVESEAVVAADLSNKLKQLGYKVAGITQAADEAVELAVRLQPQLVMVDIQLNGLTDGIQTAHAIQNRSEVRWSI